MRKNRLKFDPSFYAMTLLAIMLGYLNEYVIFALTIIVLECGHLTMAFFHKWELEELKFFAFGGIMQFTGELNKSNIEDFIVSSGGILFNFITLIILILMREKMSSFVNPMLYDYAIWAQLFVITFNLIPLPPLDGSRLINAILCCFFPYKTVLRIIRRLNMGLMTLFIGITILYDIRQLFIIVSFLTYSTLKYNKYIYFLFQRFLLQKKMYINVDLPRKIVKIRNDSLEDNIYRGYLNLFQVKNRLHDEMKWLKLKYEQNPSLIVDAQIKSD